MIGRDSRDAFEHMRHMSHMIEGFGNVAVGVRRSFREIYLKVVDRKHKRAYPLISQNIKRPHLREKGHALWKNIPHQKSDA